MEEDSTCFKRGSAVAHFLQVPKPSPRTGSPTKVSNVLQQVGWTEDTQPEGLSGRAREQPEGYEPVEPVECAERCSNNTTSGSFPTAFPIHLGHWQEPKEIDRLPVEYIRLGGAMRFQMLQQSGKSGTSKIHPKPCHQTVPWKIPHLVVGKSSIYMDIRRDYRITTRPKRAVESLSWKHNHKVGDFSARSQQYE
jgi:hypothetical protein